MREVVIVSAARTPVGKFLGALSHLSAVELGSIAVRAAVERATIDPAEVTECIMGCVLPAGLGQNPARQAALRGGLADTVSALTINMVCGSGLKAVGLAAHAIAVGDSEIAVAGGMESMSNAPYLLPTARKGFRMGNAEAIDSMVNDGLWCACDDQHMGMTGELVAEKHSITREQQDAYALNSHRKAAAAQQAGRFDAEIIPLTFTNKKGAPPIIFTHDESVRADASLEALAALKPAFKKDGTVTAGNAPGVNDAAAAVVLMSAERARISTSNHSRPSAPRPPAASLPAGSCSLPSPAFRKFSPAPTGPSTTSTSSNSTKPSASRPSASPRSSASRSTASTSTAAPSPSAIPSEPAAPASSSRFSTRCNAATHTKASPHSASAEATPSPWRSNANPRANPAAHSAQRCLILRSRQRHQPPHQHQRAKIKIRLQNIPPAHVRQVVERRQKVHTEKHRHP